MKYDEKNVTELMCPAENWSGSLEFEMSPYSGRLGLYQEWHVASGLSSANYELVY